MYQDKKKNKRTKTTRDSFFTFVFLTLCFLSQLSGIYLNDVRANIKIKKNKLVNSVALLGHGAAEVEERKRGREEEGDSEGEVELEGGGWRRRTVGGGGGV